MNQLIRGCDKFICSYKSENTCTISGIVCNGCLAFYGICEKCMQSGCAKSVINNKKTEKTDKPQKEVKPENVQKTMEPTAYVDGSFKNGIYGYGCVITRPDGVRRGLRGHDNNKTLAEMRNVAGEILGAMAAIKYAIDNQFPSLTIYYDYIGIEKWAKDEWKANKPATMAYKDFIRECPIPLKFIKVKGHSGNKGNELADQLAKKAVGIIPG